MQQLKNSPLCIIGDFIRQTSNPLPHVFTVMRVTSPWAAGSRKNTGRKLAMKKKTYLVLNMFYV